MRAWFSQLVFLLCLLHIEKLTSGMETDSSLRIASGKEVDISEVPYVLRLIIVNALCTGALINESWVLTAAHCIINPKYPDDIEMYAGFDDTSKQKEAQMRKGKSVVVHEKYWAGKISKFDFALIEAEKPFELNNNVKVLELSDDEWPQDSQMYNRKCVAAGWGADDIGRKAVNKLRALNVSARHGQDACKCFQSFHNRRLICLDEKGRGICKGDSGGALVCDNKGVGVAHVIYSKKSCDPFALGTIQLSCKDTTGAYMYICPQLDWIHEYVPSVPKTPAKCRAFQSVRTNTFLFFIIFSKFFIK